MPLKRWPPGCIGISTAFDAQPFLLCNRELCLHSGLVVTLDVAKEQVGAGRQLGFQLAVLAGFQIRHFAKAFSFFLPMRCFAVLSGIASSGDFSLTRTIS